MTSPAGDPRPVQAERMLPHQIQAAIAARSVVYLPLGSIEYHRRHLPLGLDGLTAHGICTRAAATTGGVVLPTVWFGTGGTHTGYPWTIMTPTAAPLPIDPPGQHGGWTHRHTPGHPLWGIMGPDPRTADLHQSQRLLDQIVDWVCRQVTGSS